MYLQTAIRYVYQDGFTQNWFLLWSFKVTEKQFFELSHRSNIAQMHCPEFTKTNSYFYSFTNKSNIFSSSSYQWGVGFLWICWQTKKLSIQHQNILCLLEKQIRILFFSPCIRYKSESSIDWSTKLSLTRQSLVYKNLFHQLGKIRKSSLEQHSNIPVFNLCVNWGLNVTTA